MPFLGPFFDPKMRGFAKNGQNRKSRFQAFFAIFLPCKDHQIFPKNTKNAIYRQNRPILVGKFRFKTVFDPFFGPNFGPFSHDFFDTLGSRFQAQKGPQIIGIWTPQKGGSKMTPFLAKKLDKKPWSDLIFTNLVFSLFFQLFAPEIAYF